MRIEEAINTFLERIVGRIDTIERIAGDASIREYFRIWSNKRSLVLCIDSNLAREEYQFFAVHNLFREEGIPVPEIYGVDKQNGFILLEDGGDNHLQKQAFGLEPDEIVFLYRKIIDIMVRIQTISGRSVRPPFSICFDVKKLMFEFDFFIKNSLVEYFESNCSERVLSELRDEFLKISNILFRPDLFVLNHRDYHSRNILISRSGPLIIDFQDARMGLPLYDAVSLLRDSYFMLEQNIVFELKEYHFSLLRENGFDKMSWDEYEYYFDIMGFQRNIKALGTFGYQIVHRNKRFYEKYIFPTVEYLYEYAERREEVKRAGEIVLNIIGSRG